jgi:copper resistance protein B
MDGMTHDHGSESRKPVASGMAGHGDHTQQATPAGSRPGGMGAMDHGDMNQGDMANDDMAAMNHGDMGSAQGGSPPPDARDPHAYSGGFQLDSGPYALAPRQLRLADEHRFLTLQLNRLERAGNTAGTHLAYDAQLRYGTDYERLVIRAEGEQAEGNAAPETRTEVMWSHAYGPFWDVQAGVRSDIGVDPTRNWLGFGVQGLAPYWFEIDAFAYLGEGGRTALRLGTEYELLLTQKLVLQPRAELNAYGQADEARGLGSGLSDVTAGLRLRYEINRQLAPYVGVEWASKLGATADMARAAGESVEENRWVAGVRVWF